MPVLNTTWQAGPYTVNGATTVFPFSFFALTAEEVRVYRRNSDGDKTDIVAGLTVDPAGTVTFDVAPVVNAVLGNSLYIESRPLFTQDVDLENQDAFLPAVFDEAHDRSAMRDIYLLGLINQLASGDVDLSGYATTSYVDSAIAALDLSGYAPLSGAAFSGDVSVNGHGKRLHVSWASDITGASVFGGSGGGANLASNLHLSAADALVADAVAGSRFLHNSTTFAFDTFSGATVGGAPTLVQRLRWDLGDDTWKFAGSVGVLGMGRNIVLNSGTGTDAYIYQGTAGSINLSRSLKKMADGTNYATAAAGANFAFKEDVFAYRTFSGRTVGSDPFADSAVVERLRWDLTDDTWKFAGAASFTGTITARPSDLTHPGLVLPEDPTSPSSRAFAAFGDWAVGQDIDGDGTKDFFLHYGGQVRLLLEPDGDATFSGDVAVHHLTVEGQGRFVADSVRIIARNNANLAFYAMAGADPINNEDFVTKGWGLANLGGGGGARGFREIELQAADGTLDLSSWSPGETVYLVMPDPADPQYDDPNFWIVAGGLPGDVIRVVASQDFAVIFNTGYTGANVYGQAAGSLTGGTNGTMSFNAGDSIEILCNADDTYTVFNTSNQHVGRFVAPWAGSSQNPEEAYYSIGVPGVWSATRGMEYGDALFQVNGTAGKPITAGSVHRGRGDTAASFFETYDVDADGYLIPWDSVGKIGNHITFRSAYDDGTGKLVFDFDTPPGWVTGPGSLLQGFMFQIDMFAGDFPSATSTPGGASIRTTRDGLTTPIDHMAFRIDGGTTHFGKAALEAGGTMGYLAQFLDIDRIDYWHSPAQIVSRIDLFKSTDTWISTDFGDDDTDRFADLGFMLATDITSGVEFGLDGETGIHTWLSNDAGIRGRSFGVSYLNPGLYIMGGFSNSNVRVRGGELAAVPDDQTVTVPGGVLAGRAGEIRLILSDGKMGVFSFNLDTNAMELHSGSALIFAAVTGSSASNGSGVDGMVTVYLDGTTVTISNRYGSTQTIHILVTD